VGKEDNTNLNPVERLKNKIRIESLVILVLLGILILGVSSYGAMASRVEYQPVAYAAGSMRGVAQPEEFPAETIGLFVKDYLSSRHNYSMLTARDRFKDLEPLLSPKKLLASRDRFETTLRQIQKLRMFSHHENLGSPIVKKIPGQKAFSVEQKSLSKIYHGDYPQKEEIRYYICTVQLGATSPKNPMGLYIFGDSYESDAERRAKMLDDNLLEQKDRDRMRDQKESERQARERQMKKFLNQDQPAQ
jgi:hypothetical protein